MCADVAAHGFSYIPKMNELTERTFCLPDGSTRDVEVNRAKVIKMPARRRREDRKVA